MLSYILTVITRGGKGKRLHLFPNGILNLKKLKNHLEKRL